MMRWLANPTQSSRPSIVGGECSASGPIALMAIAGDTELADKIGINANSSILVIGTEGNTDPDIYAKVTHTRKHRHATWHDCLAIRCDNRR